MLIINTETKLFGLLGYPLSQSLSPIMQNAAFKERKLNKIYIPVEVLPQNLESVVKGISKMNFEGFNVTKPYKIDIMKYLDEMDEYAKIIGAVNTVTVKDGKLKGYNTDGTGFLKSFEKETGSKIEGKTVFILGSGGAARAICMTLALNNAKKIYICNRTFKKAVLLSKDINKQMHDMNRQMHDINRQIKDISIAIPMEYNEMHNALNDSDVLINTTSVGMYPDVGTSPLDINLLKSNLIVCDIVYNPIKTKLLKDAGLKGCRTISGIYMFVYQGAEAFEIWTGIKAPTDKMLSIVENSL